MNISIFCLVSIFFYYLVFIRKNFFFGFKESFSIGFFLYVIIPIFLIFFFQSELIESFTRFQGYKTENINKFINLASLTLLFFLLGYTFLKKKIYILKKQITFSSKEIIFTLLILSCFYLLPIPYIQTTVLAFTLSCLLIYKIKISNLKKIFLLLLLVILFQYLSSHFSGARRDIIKILIISLFFLSMFIKNKKYFILLIFLLFLVSIFYVLLTTNIRSIKVSPDSNIDFKLLLNLFEFVSYYDFMPAFDSAVYVISKDEFLNGTSIFKIFFSWIPREIWENKPYDANVLVTELRRNSFVGGTAQTGASFSINLIGELYWNFGWTCVMLVSFLIGIFAKNIDLSTKEKIDDVKIIIFSSLNYLIFIMWRGGISTSIINFLLNIFFVLFLLYISRLIFRNG